MPVVFCLSQRGPNRPYHQEQPEEKSDSQEQLPKSSKIRILIPLVPKPEVCVQPKTLPDRKPLTGHGTDNDDQQTHKEKIDEKTLVFWFATGDCRSHKQPGCDPGGCNPKDSQLGVPRTCYRIGQPFCQRYSVETATFHLVMGRTAPSPT